MPPSHTCLSAAVPNRQLSGNREMRGITHSCGTDGFVRASIWSQNDTIACDGIPRRISGQTPAMARASLGIHRYGFRQSH